MAKDRESSKPSHAHPEKEEKQKKKKKRSEGDGVHKSSSSSTEKKDKKAKRAALAEKALNEIQTAPTTTKAADDDDEDEEGEEGEEEGEVVVVVAEEVEMKDVKPVSRPVGALVPFANPLADDKVAKKVFKSVKKGLWTILLFPITCPAHMIVRVTLDSIDFVWCWAHRGISSHNVTYFPFPPLSGVLFRHLSIQERHRANDFQFQHPAAAHRTLKRGVKEVVKALRKSSATTTPSSSPPLGVVILAADISPMDVISHLPVLCEDHGVPYIYVTSRAELGMAGQTKRPTSVVMVVGVAAAPKKKGGKDGKEAEAKTEGESTEEWDEVFRGLVKTVEREGRHVKV